MKNLYFDHNATTPILQMVFDAMLLPLSADFGNPGSGHGFGLDARTAVDTARQQVAALINAAPGEIVFTSCATESNNMVIQGLMRGGGRMVTSTVEHPAVLEPGRVMAARGGEMAMVPVNRDGVLDVDTAKNTIKPGTKLASIMLANNETGVIQPVWDLADHAHEQGALLHTDAAQAVGKIPVDVQALNVDLMTIAGHKLYAPKGVGALYVRSGVELPPLLFGGGQEKGIRPGTENVPYIVGLGAACELASHKLAEEMARQRKLGDILLDGMQRLGHDFLIFGENATRLPNTLFAGFLSLPASRLVEELALMDVAVSAGAACHAGDGSGAMSHVLEAMDAPKDYGLGAVRFSWGRITTESDVLELVGRLKEALAKLK